MKYKCGTSLKPYKLKDFKKILESKGFSFKRQSGDHLIYMNDNNEGISFATGKEVNAMMAKVILDRIKRNQLRKYCLFIYENKRNVHTVPYSVYNGIGNNTANMLGV